MSGNDSESDQGGAGRREVAWRVFAAEYDDASLEHSESDEERAPNYVVTPTGARINRLFVVGVLTEVEQVSDDVLRGRVVDPTGAFVLYAGQYQPDEMAFLENADPPAFVAVTGKARTFQPEDSDRVFTSIRPESINRVDAETRDRWVVQTAEQTLHRVSTFADALESGERGDALREALEAQGVDAGLAAGIPLAMDHYGTTEAYLAEVWGLSLDAARVVAGELSADDVGPLGLAPDEGGEVDVDLDYSLTDESELGDLGRETEAEPAESEAEPSDEMSPEAETPPAETRTEVGETEAVSEGSSEPEPTEEPTDAELAEAAPEPTESELAEAEPAESETTTDELGAAPTSTVEGEQEAEPETEATSEAETAPEVEDAEDAADLQEKIGDEEPPTVESEQETSTDETFEPETEGQEDESDLGTGGLGDDMYEFDEDEREEVEEEYGLEFSSGSEVSDPGEADIETPDTELGEAAEPGETRPDETAEPTSEEVEPDELQDFEPASGGTEDVVNTDEEAPAGGSSAAAESPGSSIGEDEVAESESATEAAETETAESETTESAGETGGEEPENLEDTVMDEMRDLNEGDGVERETLMAAVVQAYDVTPADVEDALEAALMAGRCYESGEDTLKPI